jgi:hypothetical protein
MRRWSGPLPRAAEPLAPTRNDGYNVGIEGHNIVPTESDEDWEHTPEHRGFRPLLGMR